VLRTLAVVVLIGLADSLNPSTVAPAVFLATAERSPRPVLAFTGGVFLTNLVAGVLLVLGPGQWLLGLLPHPSPHRKHVLEIAAGIVLIGVAAVVWTFRRKLAAGELPTARGKKSFAAGASIMLVELPTAVPYFGAVAAIVSSGAGLAGQFLLVFVFNVLFVAPLLTIAFLLAVAPRTSASLLEPVAAWLSRHWPLVFAALALVLGVGLTTIGVVGLT